MRTIWFSDAKKNTLTQLQKPKRGCWINITRATDEDLLWIAQLLDLEISDLSDALDPFELPRVERQDGGILFFLRTPQESTVSGHTSTLCALVSQEYFITISQSSCDLIHGILRHPKLPPTTQTTKIMLFTFLTLAQDFTKKIKTARQKVLEQEKELRTVDNEDIIEVTQIEEVLHQYLSALVPLRNVFETTRNGSFIRFHEKDADLLEDLVISTQQSVDVCSVSLKSIRSLRDSYEIIFTNQLNKTMKFLTSITLVLTIPTMIASLFGMNVPLPFQEYSWAFLLVISLIVVCSSICLSLFHYRKLL